MYETRRQHPLAVVHAFYNYIILLVLPLLRSLTLLRGGVLAWVQGVWQDALVLACILLFGYLRWRMNVYQIADGGMVFQEGVLFRRSRYIGCDRVASVTIEHPFYLRPFHVVRLRLETDAGSRKEPDVSLLLRRDAAEEIAAAVGSVLQQKKLVRTYTPNSWSVAFLSLITSDSLTGVLFASTLISQTGRLLGQEAEERLITGLTRLMQVVAFGLPPLAAVLAMTLLGGWLLDFVKNLIRHLGFTATRDGERLQVRVGVLTVREYGLSVEKINYLQLRQSLLTRLLGYCSVMINCTGYGKEKNELAVLLPAADQREVRRGLRMILPEIRPSHGGCHPTLRTLTRFLIPPLTTLAVMLLVLAAGWYFLPGLHQLLFFLGLMSILPALWWLLVKIAAFRFVGLEVKGSTCTFHTVFGYAFYTTSAPKSKIALAELRQSLFQRMSGCCDVVIRLRSERGRKIVVQNIPQGEAENFLREFSG